MSVVRMRYVGCPDVYVYECRVPLLEGVQKGEARHVYSWGNPDRDSPDENTCHVSLGNVCHVASGGGVPTKRFFLKKKR